LEDERDRDKRVVEREQSIVEMIEFVERENEEIIPSELQLIREKPSKKKLERWLDRQHAELFGEEDDGGATRFKCLKGLKPALERGDEKAYEVANLLRFVDAVSRAYLIRQERLSRKEQCEIVPDGLTKIVTSLSRVDAKSLVLISQLDRDSLTDLAATPLMMTALTLQYRAHTQLILLLEVVLFFVICFSYGRLISLQLAKGKYVGLDQAIQCCILVVPATYFTTRMAFLRIQISALAAKETNDGADGESDETKTSSSSSGDFATTTTTTTTTTTEPRITTPKKEDDAEEEPPHSFWARFAGVAARCFLALVYVAYVPLWIVEAVATLPAACACWRGRWWDYSTYSRRVAACLNDLKTVRGEVTESVQRDGGELLRVYEFLMWNCAGLPKLWRIDALNWVELLFFIGCVWVAFITTITRLIRSSGTPSYAADGDGYNSIVNFGILLMWLRFLDYLKNWEPTAHLVIVLTRLMYEDLLPYFAVLAILIIAFSHTLHVSLEYKDKGYFGEDIEEQPFSTPLRSVFSIYRFTRVSSVLLSPSLLPCNASKRSSADSSRTSKTATTATSTKSSSAASSSSARLQCSSLTVVVVVVLVVQLVRTIHRSAHRDGKCAVTSTILLSRS